MNQRVRRSPWRGAAVGAILGAVFVAACGWDPSKPFEREAPSVNAALGHLDGGDARAATSLLEEYLTTGSCEEGNIGTPPRVRDKSSGAFDLGLGLFKIAETYGRRFGEEEIDGGIPTDPAVVGQRASQVECALRIVRAVGQDATQPIDLRTRARYLEGNLLFLNGAYEEAVRAYEAALELAPGMADAGPSGTIDGGRVYVPDPVGRDAAWNRAVALRRIEDKKDAGNDSGTPDSGGDSGSGDSGKNDDDAGNKDAGGGKDGGGDAGGKDGGNNEPPPKKDDDKEKDAGPPPPSRQNQDERILDQLENAPTVQQEAAKKQAQKRHVRGMADK